MKARLKIVAALTIAVVLSAASIICNAADDGYITKEDIPQIKEQTVFDYDALNGDISEGLLANFDFNSENSAAELYDNVNNIKADVIAGRPGWYTQANENIREWDYSGEKLDYVDPQSYLGSLSTSDGMPRFTKRKKGAIGSYIGFYNPMASVEVENNDKIPAANNDEYSISFWVKGNDNSLRNNCVIYEERGRGKSYIKFVTSVRNLQYHYYAGGFLRVIMADENGNIILDKKTEGFPFDLSWHMITWTDKNGEASVYIDGEKDSTDFSYDVSKKPRFLKSFIGTPADEVGDAGDRCTNFYYGAVDDFYFYNRVITQPEMKQLFYKAKTGRMAWVEFENGISDYYNNLALSGKPELVKGIKGNAIRLSDEISSSKHPSMCFENSFTAAFWIKVDKNGENTVISRGNDDFNVIVGDNIAFTITQTDGKKVSVSSPLPERDKWFHVGAAADGSKIILYINAEKADEAEYDGKIQLSGNISVSKGDDIGIIDELNIYNYGCSQTELKLYQDMQPDYIRETAVTLYNMLDVNNPCVRDVVNLYRSGDYSGMLDKFRDFYFELIDEEILPQVENSVANGTWIYYGYDDEAVAYGRGFSMASFDDIGEFGDINWEYGAFGENVQYHHQTVDYWQWNLQTMEQLNYKMYIQFGQEEYFERYFKFTRDLALHRYNMLVANKSEWNAVGFQQPLHPNVGQTALEDLCTNSYYFIKTNPELARRYLSSTALVEQLREGASRYLSQLLSVTSYGNHEYDSISMASQYALRFKGLKISNEVYKQFMYFFEQAVKKEMMRDGTGYEATWHYNSTMPFRFGQAYDMFMGLGYSDKKYAMMQLKNQIIMRARMIACHIMPYGKSFIGTGSSGGAALSDSDILGGKDAEDNFDTSMNVKLLGGNSVVKNDPLINQLKNVADNKGDVPAFTSMTFPYLGNSILRTGWSDNDRMAYLTGSKFRQKEACEKNAFQLAGYGRLLLGRGGHSQGNAALGPQGDYAFTSLGNNTVNVDDNVQSPPDSYITNYRTEPINYRFLASDDFDFAEGLYDEGYVNYDTFLKKSDEKNNIYTNLGKVDAKDVEHHRQVISVKNKDVYIIFDRMKAKDEHEYHQEWHIPSSFPEDTVKNTNDGFITADDRGANVAMYQFYNDKTTSEKYYGWVNEDETLARGWEMRLYSGSWDKATDVRFNFKAKGDTVLVTVITPLKDTEEIIKSKKNIGSGTQQGFEIELTDGTILKLLTDVSPRELQIADVSTKASTLLVVEEPGSNKKGIVLDASSLSVNGKKIDCRYNNSFEFSYGDNTSVSPIKIPQTFKWVEQDGNLVPKYQNIDLENLK
ncbi:MAG: hypothetical protein J6N52_03055 [Clostridia bacterium]|nr:hypothetical protein [Clostridia bacterium]